MDALSMDIRALKKSCIHIAQPDGRLIPFESFNLFYRDENARKLAVLRAEVEAATRSRLEGFAAVESSPAP
jgi:7,8-dihydro-6-hydroxymethylpterin dimethyltransferase